MAASRVPPTRDLACNTGMCPDGELNRQPFGLQDDAQLTELHQSGLCLLFSIQFFTAIKLLHYVYLFPFPLPLLPLDKFLEVKFLGYMVLISL